MIWLDVYEMAYFILAMGVAGWVAWAVLEFTDKIAADRSKRRNDND